MRKTLLSLFAWMFVTAAQAGVPCTLPFNLLNGTTADATQVMANYNQLVSCLANAAAAGANSDITALLGLTTPLSPSSGGSNVYIATAASGGTANAQTVPVTIPTGFSLSAGNRVIFVAGFTNTGPMTLSVNGLTATNVDRYTSSGPQPLIGSEVVLNNLIEAVFDGTQFQLYTNAVTTVSPTLLQNYIAGLNLSTAGGSSSFGIAVGEANDRNNGALMLLNSAYTKTTASWAVGSGNGCLDTGSIAINTWYHTFEIERPDTGVVDVLCSLSATAPTMPTSYTLFRRIGSMKTDGSSHWLQFVQVNDEFLWSTPPQDVTVTNLGTTATLFALSVPPAVQVDALIRGNIASATIAPVVLINSPDETVQTANSPAGNGLAAAVVANQAFFFGQASIRTNTSQQVRAVSTGANTSLNIVTSGWIDRRGKL